MGTINNIVMKLGFASFFLVIFSVATATQADERIEYN